MGSLVIPLVGSSTGWPGRTLLDLALKSLQPEARILPDACCDWQSGAFNPRDVSSTCGAADDLGLAHIGYRELNHSDLSQWVVPNGTERVLRIRSNHGSAGFFAYVLFAINQLVLAHEAGVTPYVDFSECTVNGHDHPASGGRNLYYDERYGSNMWEQYFEPVSSYRPRPSEADRKTASAATVPPRKYDVRSLSSAQIWDVHHRKPSSSIFAYPYGMYTKVFENGFNVSWSRTMHERAAAAVKRFIRVKPGITAKVDAFWQEHVGPEDRVLGVHVRGTDKQPDIGGAVLGPERYFPAIERWSFLHPGSPIFVASDSPSFIKKLQDKYGHRILVRNALRSEKNAFLDSSVRDNYRKGEDVLIDALLLARCSFLLKSSSAVAEFATWFNPELGDRSIDLQYSKEAPSAVLSPLLLAETPTATHQMALAPRARQMLLARNGAELDSEESGDALERLKTVLRFLECKTALFRHGVTPVEDGSAGSTTSRCSTTDSKDSKNYVQRSRQEAVLAKQLSPLILDAEALFSELASDMPVRPGMPNPKPLDRSPAVVAAQLDVRSETARQLEPSDGKVATIDLVISRCNEEVEPWLPRLVSHFAHDVTVKVVIAELCVDRCIKMAGSHTPGLAPARAERGLVEACVLPRQRSVLGAKVEHHTNPDVGYESAGYLKYIVDTMKTKSLADSTLFIQAGWDVHSPRMLESNVLEHHMSTSSFSMYAPLYEMLPQKGCTDWCLAGTVWKHTLPEQSTNVAEKGYVGNAAYGLFHAKREAIEKRSLENWELAYRALIGKHAPLNHDLCAPLQRFNINMSSLMDTPYGADLIRLIRGKLGKPGERGSIDTPKMVGRLGTWLDLDNRQNMVESDNRLTGRSRLKEELRYGSPLCFENKRVKHCKKGFQFGAQACDPEYMISEQMLTEDGQWPCCDMHGGAEDGIDQALLSLHTRIFYCAATAPADKGKLMGVAYEHSWHMLFGEPPILPLSKAPLMNTKVDDTPAFTTCPEKDSMVMPTTSAATRIATYEAHTRNILYRIVRSGLQALEGVESA